MVGTLPPPLAINHSLPILLAATVLVLALGAEALHHARVRRVARLAFGPEGRPAWWASLAPLIRALLLAALAWGLCVLLLLPPKAHRSSVGEVDPSDRRHLLLVLDVSPSMRLQDAGAEGSLSRAQRSSAIVQSLLKRVSDEHLFMTVVATYSAAKPVVIESRDREVLLNILNDLNMHYAFETGKTKLFAGLEEAARIARGWKPDSATLVVLSDGDTVPAGGMPKMPPAVGGALVIGVGDPQKGTFIDGRQSRQDVATLRQIANRLGGEYHDGNLSHIPTAMLRRVGSLEVTGDQLHLTLREYALISCAISSFGLAFLPVLLHLFGSRWNPGPPAVRPAPQPVISSNR